MKAFIYEVLKMIDQFGNPVQVKINKKMKYVSSVGGIFTMILLACIIFFSVYFGTDMAFKQNPKLINYKSYVVDNDTRINNTNFFLAFQVLYPNKSIVDLNNPYFKLLVLSESMNTIYPNETVSGAEYLESMSCNKSHLAEFEVNDKLKNYIADAFTCIKLNNTYLNGSPFHSLSTRTLRLNVNFAYYKLVKDFGSDLNLYLKGVFPLTFRIFYQSYSYNPDNYLNPFKKELAFADIRVVLTSITHVYASFIRAKSVRDDALLLSSSETDYLYGFNDFKVFPISNVFIPGVVYFELMKAFFYLDYYEENFLRSYTKLQDVGAQVSAISKLIFFVLQFAIFFYSFNRINEQLAYRFYKFVPEKNINPDYDYFNEGTPLGQLDDLEMNNNDSNRNALYGRNKTSQLNTEKDNPNKLLGSTSLPPIFLNSIFSQQGKRVNGKVGQTAERKSVYYLSAHSAKRKMAMKFNFVGNNLNRRRTKTAERSVFNKKATNSPNELLDMQPLNSHNKNPFMESLPNTKNRIKDPVFDEQKKSPLAPFNHPNSGLKVIESSLRVNNKSLKNVLGGKRSSFKINNDKTYITGGEENEDGKIDTEKIIQNFSEKDLMKSKEKLGFIDKFKGFACCRSKITPELKMKLEFYEKAGTRINDKIDIVHFLNMFDEFNKFKILFLNPYQALALKYSKKANIFNINFSNVIDYYERFCNTNDHGLNIKKVMDYFTEKLKTRSLDMMDQKLMEILDVDLKKAILMSV